MSESDELRRVREEEMRRLIERPRPVLQTRQPQNEPAIVVRKLPELREMPDAEVEWLAERFLALGAISDLVAYIKTGKTTLISQLIAAVLHGEKFLGLTVKKAPVVLLSEERVATLLMAMDEARIEDSDDLHVLLWNEQRGIPWPEIVSQARSYCTEVEAKLLVVDTLGMWADVDDEQQAHEAKRAMVPLLESAVGIAIAVLRQARKTGGEIHNAGRGSGAYGGAADILLHLDYIKDEKGQKVLEDSSKRLLTIKSRLERESVPPMELDYDQGRYFSTAPMVIGTRTREQILEDLDRHGPSTPAEISRRTGAARNTVVKTLGRMTEVSGLEGVYKLEPKPALAPDDKNGDRPVTAPIVTATPQTGDKTPPPYRGGGEFVTAAADGVERFRRHRCPNCGGKAYLVGPAGLPQRRCHGCGALWTPGEGASR